MKNALLTSATLIFLAVGASTSSMAQISREGGGMIGMMGGGCPMMEMMGGAMMGQGVMGARQARIGAMADGRLAFLKSALNITESQTEAWNGYADAVKSRVAKMQDMHSAISATMQKGNAIERMDARLNGMKAMVEAMGALKPATEKLYNALTPEQKKIADDLIGIGCGAM